MPSLISDGAKLAEMLALHARGLSQRDVADELGVSQRAVCYALKRLRLPPNGYDTRASARKRSRASREVWRLRRHRRASSQVVRDWWQAEWPLAEGYLSPQFGYSLFAVLCRLGSVAHAEPDVQLLPRGRSILARAPSDRLRELVSSLPAGTRIRAAGGRIALGVPEVRPMRPSGDLDAWCVTMKGYTEAAPLAGRLRDELGRLGISPRAALALGERRIVAINSKRIVGYGARISGVEPRASLVLQAAGLGGRRRFGCGVFLPC